MSLPSHSGLYPLYYTCFMCTYIIFIIIIIIIYLYLCSCPGEVTLQHAGKLVCVNCCGVGPFHSVRQYLLSYSVNCCLPLTDGEIKLAALRRCTLHKGCLSTGSPDSVHRTIVCRGYIDCLDKQWVAGSLMMMTIIATIYSSNRCIKLYAGAVFQKPLSTICNSSTVVNKWHNNAIICMHIGTGNNRIIIQNRPRQWLMIVQN